MSFIFAAHEVPAPIRWPKSYGSYPMAYYPWFIFLAWSAISSALLGPNSCLFFGSLIGYLNNEFKILCLAYRNVFEELSDNEKEEISEESLENITGTVSIWFLKTSFLRIQSFQTSEKAPRINFNADAFSIIS